MSRFLQGEGKRVVEIMRGHTGVDIAATIPIELGGGSSFAPLIATGRLAS